MKELTNVAPWDSRAAAGNRATKDRNSLATSIGLRARPATPNRNAARQRIDRIHWRVRNTSARWTSVLEPQSSSEMDSWSFGCSSSRHVLASGLQKLGTIGCVFWRMISMSPDWSKVQNNCTSFRKAGRTWGVSSRIEFQGKRIFGLRMGGSSCNKATPLGMILSAN